MVKLDMQMPKIPGMSSEYYSIYGKRDFRRSQVLANMNNPAEAVKAEESRFGQNTKGLKKWCREDAKVLRFYGYFVERVEEMGCMVDRIRKVVICYYTLDETLDIHEPKIMNSGIVQGVFMKRAKELKKNNNCTYMPSDFKVGQQIHIRGRDITIVDADQSTRDYYDKELKMHLSEKINIPEKLEIEEVVKVNKVQAVRKEYKGQQMQQFLKNDRKVLRFYCTWNDPHPMYPEMRKYVLHYYLSDDMIEILEVKQNNSGRDAFPLLLSKRKLQKNNDEHITMQDLHCGQDITIFNRCLKVTDCDEYTKTYYQQTLGITQVPVQAKESAKVVHPTSFDEDSGIFRRILAPKPVQKNVKIMNQLDRKVLRFRGKFVNPKSVVDQTRHFVVTFFLIDDTMAIYEPPQRNSGVVGGKFLDRGVYNHYTSSNVKVPFRKQDFYNDAIIAGEFAPQQKIKLVEADEQTLNYCESHPEDFPYSDIQKISDMLCDYAQKQHISLPSLCSKYKPGATDLLKEEFDVLMQQAGVKSIVNQHQWLTLCRYIAKDEALVNIKEFADTIARAQERKEPTLQDSFLCQLRHVQMSLRKMLQKIDHSSSGIVSRSDMEDLLQFYHITSTDADLANYTNVDGNIDYIMLLNAIYKDESGAQGQFTWPEENNDVPIEEDFSGFFGYTTEKQCATEQPQLATQEQTVVASLMPDSIYGNAKAVAILQAKYGNCKYKLRKRLREHDTNKSGLLGMCTICDFNA